MATMRTSRLSVFVRSAAVGLLYALAGCIAPDAKQTLSIWAVGPSEWVRAGDPARGETEYFSSSRNQLELFGAVNEVVQWQMALTADRARSAVTLEWSALTSAVGTLPPDGFRAYLERTVRIQPAPATYLRRFSGAAGLDVPDLLIPLTSPALRAGVPIGPDAAAVLWCEYVIPRTARPGEYHGAMVLRQGEETLRRVAVVLTVHPFALPVARHVAFSIGLNVPRLLEAQRIPRTETASPRGVEAVVNACRVLQEHRADPYLRGLYPPMRFGADGSVELNWAAFDALAGPLVDGTAYSDHEPPKYWPLPIDRARPNAEAMGGMDSPEYARVLRETLNAALAHFRSRGWDGRAVVDLTSALPTMVGMDVYAIARRLGHVTRLADARVPIVSSLFPVSMRDRGWRDHPWQDVGDHADIWAPPAQFFPPDFMSQARHLGRRTWLSPDQPEFAGSAALGAMPVDTRAMGYHAWLNASDVWLKNGGEMLPDAALSQPQEWRPFEPALLYGGAAAGTDGVLPSMRLKQILRAAQDFEYLWLLQQNQREATARLVAESMVKASGTATCIDNYSDPAAHLCILQPEMWDLARRVMAEEIGDAISSPAGAMSRGEPLEKRLGWSRLLGATRQVLVWSDGVKWKESLGGGWEVEFFVAVENQRRQPIRGKLAFGPLPNGWTTVSEFVEVGPLPEGGRGRYRLTARSPAWAETLDGHFEQPVRLQLEGGETVLLSATVSSLLARRNGRPITIDGRLDDWDLGRGNVAGDFSAIGPGPRGGAWRPARFGESTLAYVARDNEALFVAVRCSGTPPPQFGGQHANRMNYDGLIPIGEELVELLIDPTNRGTDAGELYHLVFWRHGAWWGERGIVMERPIAEARPWAPNIRYYTAVEPGGWTVEARIPLSAFEGGPALNRAWGINFARYAAGAGQYVNWAGAMRYCYNPRTFGNMAFAP